MDKITFSGTFNMLDYIISHKVLLFRSLHLNENNKNIDIIFEGVFYLELPTRIHGFQIYEADVNTFTEISNKHNEIIRPEFGKKIFSIQSDNKQYYIGCVRVMVKENTLDPLESSIR